MRRGVAILAHALFAIELVGAVLMVVLDGRYDASLFGWRSPQLLFAALTIVVGWLIAWKRPRIPIGWLFLSIGLIGALQGPAAAIGWALRTSDPVAAGWAIEFSSQSSWTWLPALSVILIFVPLRFPNGALPSRRWTWFWWFSVAALIVSIVLAATFERSMWFDVPNPTYVDWGPALGIVELVSVVPLAGVMLGALASLFVRYRRGRATERAQLRWLFWALAIAASLLILGGVENAIFGDEDSGGIRALVANIIDFANSISYSLIPLAILIAVLRSGLYSIDRIISRTAAYAVVTLAIVVIYAGVVILTGVLLPDLPSVGVALATLIAAALFLPLLRVVRRVVNRRFDREQYDAQKVVEAFGERIRNGADPYTAGSDLLGAVTQTLQPSAIGIWTPR